MTHQLEIFYIEFHSCWYSQPFQGRHIGEGVGADLLQLIEVQVPADGLGKKKGKLGKNSVKIGARARVWVAT